MTAVMRKGLLSFDVTMPRKQPQSSGIVNAVVWLFFFIKFPVSIFFLRLCRGFIISESGLAAEL